MASLAERHVHTALMSQTPQIDAAFDHLPPAQIGPVSLREGAREALKSAIEHDVPGLAAEVAYHAALAVLPFLLLLAALPSVLGSVLSLPDLAQEITRESERLLSQNSARMIQTLVEEVSKSSGWTALAFGLLGTLWAGTSTTSSLRKALNRLYGFEENAPLVKRKLIELGVTAVAGSLYFVAVLALLLGPRLLGGSNLLTQGLALAFAMVVVLAAVSFVYWLAPAAENTLRWITPGAVVFLIAWLLFSAIFSIYLSRIGTVNQVYGSLGAMIVMLVWLYGSNFALLLGAELNAVLGKRFDPQVASRSDES